jgi:hypothetical protein
MSYLRGKIGLAGIGALAAVIGVTLLVVLPALASNPGHLVAPASTTAHVLPYDVAQGGTGDCANLFSGGNSLGTVKEYDNVNPKNATGLKSGNGDGVTFNLAMHTANNQAQTLDVTSSGGGAVIFGIGIKGGTQSTAYNYKLHTGAGFVTGDTGLHAPLQSFTYDSSTNTETGNQFYSISQLSVCYKIMSFIEGTVYLDKNQSGANDSGDSARTGWTVSLYSGVTPGTAGGGTLLASQTTTGSGAYHFDIPADGTHYRVCEVPNPSDTPPTGGSGVWVETQPLPSATTLCQGSGELAKGYDFTPVSSAGATDDFGNVGGYPCSAAGAPVTTAPYTVGECKAGQTYVFNSGTLQNGAPFVDYWVGDPSKANTPVVEQLNFADPIDPVSGQPKYTKLLYADGGAFPVDLNNLLTMKYCNVDPRTDLFFALSSQYDDLVESGAVLPSGQTSCVISIKTTAPASLGDVGTLQAYVYALGDSIRSSG